MFGCTCNGDFDHKCTLAPYHGMEGGMANVEPPVVTQDFELEKDSNMVHSNDDWQYVAFNRTEVVSPLSIEAKQALRQGSFEVIPSMFKRILEHVPVHPHVDVFASKANAKLPTYWTIHRDAFKQDWSNETLWICPPFSQLDAVVEKIMADKAEGILLIPVWKNKQWSTELHRVAVMWWDLPQNAAALQTPSGKPIPSRRDMSLRAVAFNATGADEYKKRLRKRT